MTETPHAALIAKLQRSQFITYAGLIRLALPESVVAEAIAALQATPVGIGHWTPDEIADLNDEAWRKAHL